jgi:uncharacterized membrane protein (DUF485 family)
MSLQTRVVRILTQPAGEWRTIAGESASVEGLIRSYAAPLAAIPAIAQFIGFSVIGMPVPVLGGAIRIGIVRSFANAVVAWVFALVGAWIAAMVIEKLAATFQSKGNSAQALKLVVYSMTPVWVAGVLYLVPPLAPLVVIAELYAVYLVYVGLGPVMSTPSDKIIPYMVVSAVAIIIVTYVLGTITAAIFGIGTYRTF